MCRDAVVSLYRYTYKSHASPCVHNGVSHIRIRILTITLVGKLARRIYTSHPGAEVLVRLCVLSCALCSIVQPGAVADADQRGGARRAPARQGAAVPAGPAVAARQAAGRTCRWAAGGELTGRAGSRCATRSGSGKARYRPGPASLPRGGALHPEGAWVGLRARSRHPGPNFLFVITRRLAQGA